MSLSGAYLAWEWTASTSAHPDSLLPVLVILPWYTVSAELRTDGTMPAYEHSLC